MTEQTPSILIVDNDVALVAALATQLEAAGYTVHKANEPAQAELLYLERQPDLVLLETDIGRGRGWDLLERLAPLVPVIVLSGLGLEEHVVRGLDAGAADYLTKPYRSGELLARIRARMASRREELPAQAVAEPRSLLETPEPEPSTPPVWVERADPGASPPERPTLARTPDDDETPVFIDIASEARLLAEAEAEAAPTPLDDGLAGLPLGARLNAARRQRNISLVQVENDTHIRMWYTQAMEEEKFALLPRGAGSEQMVQTYAAYLGLDAPSAVEEYRRMHFNPQVAPLNALGGVPRARALPRWPFLLLAAVLALLVSAVAISYLDPEGTRALGDAIASWLGLTSQP
jgi:CheY-like chemotaxis protein